MDFSLPSSSPIDAFVAFRAQVPDSSFDGNDSARTVHWLFPNELFTEVDEGLATKLMAATIEGQLDWVLFPTDGYRL